MSMSNKIRYKLVSFSVSSPSHPDTFKMSTNVWVVDNLKLTKPKIDIEDLKGSYQHLRDLDFKAIKTLKSKKSSGYDEISSDVIKHISPLIFDPLKYIFNLSLEKGIFPDQLKIAKVTPLFKKGDNASMDNYRPISVLPCFSKMLERIIYNRFYTFFIENDILYEKQFGFQKQHSTEHAIIHLVNDIFKSFDSNLLFNTFIRNYYVCR